jgi:hypothetical protein
MVLAVALLVGIPAGATMIFLAAVVAGIHAAERRAGLPADTTGRAGRLARRVTGVHVDRAYAERVLAACGTRTTRRSRPPRDGH